MSGFYIVLVSETVMGGDFSRVMMGVSYCSHYHHCKCLILNTRYQTVLKLCVATVIPVIFVIAIGRSGPGFISCAVSLSSRSCHWPKQCPVGGVGLGGNE